jgi:hypothetical protein
MWCKIHMAACLAVLIYDIQNYGFEYNSIEQWVVYASLTIAIVLSTIVYVSSEREIKDLQKSSKGKW